MPPAEVPTGQDMVTIVEDIEPLTDMSKGGKLANYLKTWNWPMNS